MLAEQESNHVIFSLTNDDLSLSSSDAMSQKKGNAQTEEMKSSTKKKIKNSQYYKTFQPSASTDRTSDFFSSLELFSADEKLKKIICYFNRHPSKAIPKLYHYFQSKEKNRFDNMVKSKKSDNDLAPPIVAHILHTTPGLSSEKVREFLMKNENSNILRAFFDEMNFSVSLLDAMRSALSVTGLLIGSIEDIDHVLRVFSFSFYYQNKTAFRVLYVYFAAFSIVLLNNEILQKERNINAQDFERIISNVFPLKYKEMYPAFTVFKRISKKPLAQQIFNPNEISINFQCELEKKSNKWNSVWQKRHVSMLDNRIIFFEDEKLKKPRSSIILSGAYVKNEKKQKKQIMITSTEGGLNYIKIQPNKSNYQNNVNEISLRFKSKEERGLCSFTMKKALLLSFFQVEIPPLSIPAIYLL